MQQPIILNQIRELIHCVNPLVYLGDQEEGILRMKVLISIYGHDDKQGYNLPSQLKNISKNKKECIKQKFLSIKHQMGWTIIPERGET